MSDFNDECEHVYIKHNNKYVCDFCGLESQENINLELDLYEDKFLFNINDILKKSLNNIYNIDLIFNELYDKVLYNFNILLHDKNYKIKIKHALVGVICMYLSKSTKIILTCKDICRCFKITKKKFSIARKIFLNKYPEFSVYNNKVVDFIFRFDISKKYFKKIYSICENIDYNNLLNNLNPYIICAYIVYIIDENFINKNIIFKNIKLNMKTIKLLNKIIININV